jgi:hypothetical protein
MRVRLDAVADDWIQDMKSMALTHAEETKNSCWSLRRLASPVWD